LGHVLHQVLFIYYGFALFLLLTILAGGWWLPRQGVEHETASLKMASPCFSIKAALAGRPSPLVPILES